MPNRRAFLASSATLAAAAAAPAGLHARGRDESNRKLGYALVGLGRLSTNQLAPAFDNCTHSKLAAVVSGTPEKREKWKAKYDLGDHVYDYDDWEKIAEDDAVDVIYVVTPNGLHKRDTLNAAGAGKHVFCEKPMANTSEDCRAMIAKCEDAGKKLGIAYRCQFEPHHLRAKEVIESGKIGQLLGLGAAFGFKFPDPPYQGQRGWRIDRELAGGGPLMDVGIYALQFCRMMTGREPGIVTAQTSLTDPLKFDEVEETLFWTMQFPSVLSADGSEAKLPQVAASCGTTYAFNGMKHGEAFGTNGSVLLDPAFGYTGITGYVKGERMDLQTPDQFAVEMDAFSKSILEDTDFKCPGEEGLKDLLAIEAIYKAAESGKAETVASV